MHPVLILGALLRCSGLGEPCPLPLEQLRQPPNLVVITVCLQLEIRFALATFNPLNKSSS